MIRIFQYEEGVLKLTEHVPLVKELKLLMDKYGEDALPVLKYVYLITAPDSPFANLTEEDRYKEVSEEAGGDFSLDDPDIHVAIDKLKHLYETPTSRIYEAMKISIDRLSTYLTTAIIESGRDGNDKTIDSIQNNMGKKIESFKKLEKIKDDEQRDNLRGGASKGLY